MILEVKDFLEDVEKNIGTEKYYRLYRFSIFSKSNEFFKVPLGELYYEFNEKIKQVSITDFYILSVGCGYKPTKIKKEIHLIFGKKEWQS